jgi:orotate phosphoribosyltransferase-like protein
VTVRLDQKATTGRRVQRVITRTRTNQAAVTVLLDRKATTGHHVQRAITRTRTNQVAVTVLLDQKGITDLRVQRAITRTRTNQAVVNRPPRPEGYNRPPGAQRAIFECLIRMIRIGRMGECSELLF